MNTGNWQIKMLTLCMTAFTLCLTAACGDAGTEYTSPERITPSAPFGDGSARDDRSTCEANSSENTLARREEVSRKYEDMFSRHPYISWVSVMDYIDENGEWATTNNSIVVQVSKKVDQSTLPPEKRIPDCLEGIPVQIIEIGPFTPL